MHSIPGAEQPGTSTPSVKLDTSAAPAMVPASTRVPGGASSSGNLSRNGAEFRGHPNETFSSPDEPKSCRKWINMNKDHDNTLEILRKQRLLRMMLARLSMDHFHTQILENNPRNQLHPQDVPIFDVASTSCQTTTPSQWWKHYQSTWNTGDLGPTLNCMLLHLLSPYICMENASVEYTGFLSLSLSRVGTWKKMTTGKKISPTLGKK